MGGSRGIIKGRDKERVAGLEPWAFNLCSEYPGNFFLVSLLVWKMSAVQLLSAAPENGAQNGASLLHSRDTETRGARRRPATTYLSVI